MSTIEDRGSERRMFVRYKLKATADIVIDGHLMEQGEVDNISTGGMFLRLENEISEKLRDQTVHASIRATASKGEVTIEAGCSIVRTEPGGVALFFASIDGANRQILRDLIGELNDMVRNSRV